jgi:hypothetical protein
MELDPNDLDLTDKVVVVTDKSKAIGRGDHSGDLLQLAHRHPQPVPRSASDGSPRCAVVG